MNQLWGMSMIVNIAGTRAISNMGSLDEGKLWSYGLGDPRPELLYLSDAKWISLIRGENDYFALIHQQEDKSLRVTAHSFANIAEIISSIELNIGDINAERPSEIAVSKIIGRTSVWSSLPKTYIIRSLTEPYLVLVNWNQQVGQIQPLPWYKESYDTMYQGLLEATDIPGSPLVTISVQRDSQPVLYDPVKNQIVRKLKLGDRRGNPQLFFRKTKSELWATDYDTLVRLNARDWSVLNILRLQEPKVGMERLFIGKYSFDFQESICAVARPFEGDVVGINPDTFAVTHRAVTGGQPQDVGLLSERHVVSRDWKTGQLMQGILEKV